MRLAYLIIVKTKEDLHGDRDLYSNSAKGMDEFQHTSLKQSCVGVSVLTLYLGTPVFSLLLSVNIILYVTPFVEEKHIPQFME